ncbi:MAG TPA: MFS transporter [Gemmatimonadaceae bacterium]|jgi:MFS family permease
MGKLVVLLVTAFVDMLGGAIVFPLLPFFAERVIGHGPLWTALNAIGLGGAGFAVALLFTMFSVAQLASAPLWGRVSDKIGRRPALMIGLGASVLAYIVFAFAQSLELLVLCRLVQGAGGGTVSVVQAYVSDASKPEDRAKSLGWVSAATNAGVAMGPAIGIWVLGFGVSAQALVADPLLKFRGPGLAAALIAAVNMAFAWFFLKESHDAAAVRASGKSLTRPRDAVRRVVSHSAEPSSRLIWIYGITMGAFTGMNAALALYLKAKFDVSENTFGYFFTYVAVIGVVVRAFFLGKLVDWLKEPRLSRVGMVLLSIGLFTMPLAASIPVFALCVALVPIGTAFTFPCVTSLLSQVVPQHERGLYMGVQQTFGGLARVIAPLSAGIAYDRVGHASPFYAAGLIVMFVSIPLGLGMERYVKQPYAVETPSAA